MPDVIRVESSPIMEEHFSSSFALVSADELPRIAMKSLESRFASGVLH